MRNMVFCFTRGLDYTKWELGYVKGGCWHPLGAWLCETRLLASFGGWVTRNRRHIPLFLVVGVIGGYTWHFLVLRVSFWPFLASVYLCQ